MIPAREGSGDVGSDESSSSSCEGGGCCCWGMGVVPVRSIIC